MRIACLATSSVPSRTANSIQVMKVCHALASLGHRVRLLVPGRDPGRDWADIARHYGLCTPFEVRWVGRFRGLRNYDFCVRAVHLARRWGADLFYVWPYPAAALAARMRYATVLEVHDCPRGRLGPIWMRAFLRAGGARRLLVTTETLRAWLEGAYGVSLQSPFAIVAPNGVELERYEGLPPPAGARARLGMSQGFTACYTGHLYAGRGIGLILELARRNPGIHFLVAGGEPTAVGAWRRQLIQGEVGNVQLLGFVPNEQLPLIQAAGDVLLMPHERQVLDSGGGDIAELTSPMKMFEYLASGRPILASDLPILREVLNEGNAVLLPPEDVEAWNAALVGLVKDDQRRAALGEHARRDARRYTWTERARKALEALGV